MNKLAILAVAAWALLLLGTFTTSFIFAVYLAEMAIALASNRNNLIYATSAAVISFSTLSMLSRILAVDLIYAAVVSVALLVGSIANERSPVFKLIIAVAVATALMPYMQTVMAMILKL